MSSGICESLPTGSDRRDMVSQVMVRVESPGDAPQVAEEIDALFENSPDPTTTESERLFLLNFVSFLGNFKLFLTAICGAVTFTILLVSGNTLSMSVGERVRDVGILKTLGFTPSAILGMVLGEAAVIALAGGATAACWLACCAVSLANCSCLHPRYQDARRDAADCLPESLGRAPDRPVERAAAVSQRFPDVHTQLAAPHGIATMAIPIVYNLRNLVVRKTTTIMTALGIALAVAVLVADVALVRGLRSVFEQ